MCTMIIGGDIVPTETNYDIFAAGDVQHLAGEALLAELRAADFRIFNLETPLTDTACPIAKCGPNLITPTRTLPGIKAFAPSLLALANNHILDEGAQGLASTMRLLKENDLPFIGAGHNLSEAQQPYIFEAEGKKIGIYNCAEHEFTIAEADKPGANPFDWLDSPDHIAALKNECDFVVVLYHGGKEHYRYPSPLLQKVCRKIADKGADLVVCQHSHCVGCMERYHDSVLVYGQGNFLFDDSDSEFWQTSLLVKVSFGRKTDVSFLPLCKRGNTVRLAEGNEAEQIMSGFEERSNEIRQPDKIAQLYRAFCMEHKDWYLYALAGGEANLGIPFTDFKPQYNQDSLLMMINYLTCEPHRELVTNVVTELAQKTIKS